MGSGRGFGLGKGIGILEEGQGSQRGVGVLEGSCISEGVGESQWGWGFGGVSEHGFRCEHWDDIEVLSICSHLSNFKTTKTLDLLLQRNT